jgi:DNA-binding winged helix-turn-helix (wHTH) protein/Tol biopolymer transport system component
MDVHKETGFTLGDVQVSPSHNQLSARGQTLKLQPKVMAVLHYLALNHGRVISNEELIKQLWEGRIVTHGSVQKSINALRSAFSELVGEQEFIAHYSKRGYQLKVEPQFADLASRGAPSVEPLPPLVRRRWPKLVIGVASILAAVLLLYKASSLTGEAIPNIPKHHKTAFTTTQGYTNETGHERHAVPHPDNKHVAYIHEKFNASLQGETDSEIVIRNSDGKDWRVTSSHGSWFKLAWSPEGKQLVAVEVKRDQGLPLSPNFYEKANYLYSFHIFTLDLNNNRVIEKQLLSQWQGRIFSVTWWDEITLEFVAKQGSNSGSARYRYSTQDQHLIALDDVDGAANPVASAVLGKRTAVASSHKNKIQIDFLDEQQKRISRWQLDFPVVDISWIPDGSGILVYAEEERKLSLLYLDGQQVQIPLIDAKDRVFSRPRYRPDGAAIFYTEEKRSSNIIVAALDGAKTRLTENNDFNYSASFSPKGDKVVYASVRNNQIHLWLVENGQERQLTDQPISQKVGAIIWSNDGEHLVYNAGTNLYHYNLLTAKTALLLSDSDKVEPVAYFPDTHKLFVTKSNREVRNLWRIDDETKLQKQLTFGSLGSAIEYDGDVFFQYAGEKGLWSLRRKNDALEQVSAKLGENTKLLKADDKGVYFIQGGQCRESDIYYFQFSDSVTSTRLTRATNIVSTTSFNPTKGTLQTDCYLAESNLVLLK